ncbi:MAG TPA: hypothetical protein VIP98_00035 [Microlunatus sp.]
MTDMSQGERREFASLIKQRAKLEKQKAEAYGKQLIANADTEMERQFQVEDLGIQKIQDWVSEGYPSTVRIGGRVQFDRDQLDRELDALVAAGRRPANKSVNP